MKRVMQLAFAAALAVGMVGGTLPSAHAGDGGDVAAGVAGGLLGGLLLGGALNQGPRYYEPAPPPRVYYAPAPVYERDCYWTRGPRYWDDWSGRWRRERVRVCE